MPRVSEPLYRYIWGQASFSILEFAFDVQTFHDYTGTTIKQKPKLEAAEFSMISITKSTKFYIKTAFLINLALNA
jgi:hypothetical protein